MLNISSAKCEIKAFFIFFASLYLLRQVWLNKNLSKTQVLAKTLYLVSKSQQPKELSLGFDCHLKADSLLRPLLFSSLLTAIKVVVIQNYVAPVF